MLSAWEIRIQTFRRMLDMNREVDNGPLVGTISASAVILDSQPAELQGNECCCWSCQPVVIHYGRGGSQGSKEISQHEAFPGDFFLHFMLMYKEEASLPAYSTLVCFSDGGEEALIQVSLSQPWASEWIWTIFSQLCGWSSLLVATSLPAPGMSSDSGRQQVLPQLQPRSFWLVLWEDKWAVL